MDRKQKNAILALLTGGLLSAAFAEDMITMNIGMTWPRTLLSTGIPTGDAQIMYGTIIDKKVALGIAGNFLWNTLSKEVKDSTHYRTVSAQKTFMFPIMGFFQLDPVPNLIVHPVAHFQIGYNSLIYSYTQTDSTGEKPLSPYFYGLIMKTGIDALYPIGERSSLLIGLEYRWAGTKTASTKENEFDKRDMGGIGLHAGFRVIM